MKYQTGALTKQQKVNFIHKYLMFIGGKFDETEIALNRYSVICHNLILEDRKFCQTIEKAITDK